MGRGLWEKTENVGGYKAVLSSGPALKESKASVREIKHAIETSRRPKADWC